MEHFGIERGAQSPDAAVRTFGDRHDPGGRTRRIEYAQYTGAINRESPRCFVASPDIAITRHQHRARKIVRRHVPVRLDRLETQAIESKQAVAGGKPQKTFAA